MKEYKSYSEAVFDYDNAKNGEESREPIAGMLDVINSNPNGVVNSLVGSDGKPVTYKQFMTPVQVKAVFNTGTIEIDGKTSYVYITSIDKTITTNNKKKLLSNKAFYQQLGIIDKILEVILNSKKINT